MNQVSTSIKQLRKEKSLSQEQLAEQLHVTRQAVSNWENGKTQPDIDTLTALSEAFSVSIERLIYGKEKPRFHFAVKIFPRESISLGMMIAVVISYTKWHSIGWAILHGILGWLYVLYCVFAY